MKQNGNALIIGILIGLVIAAGLFGAYYFGTQKNMQNFSASNPSSNTQITAPTSPAPTDQTANWKTYTSKVGKVSFSYPADWEITLNSNSGATTDDQAAISAFLTPANFQVGDARPGIIGILFVDNSQNLTLPEFEKKYSVNVPVGLYNSESKQMTIGGIDGSYSETMGRCDPNKCSQFVVSLPNRFIVFQNYNTGTQVPNQKEIFEKVISTLKVNP